MTIFYLMHERWLNHWVFSNQQELIYLNQRDSNRRDLSDSIRRWCDLNRRDSKLKNFWTQLFNFKIILVLRILENVVASKVLNFTFCFTMPWSAPVGDIRRPYDRVEDVEAPLPGTGNLWDYASDGFRLIHTSTVICIPPETNTNFIKILTSAKG